MVRKSTFKNKSNNAAQIAAGGHIVIESQAEALKNNNIPHNQAIISNQDTTSTLFIYLDDFSDQDSPDFTLFPTQQLVIGWEDGFSWTTMFIKNNDAVNIVAAKSLKYNIQTIKDVKDFHGVGI